VVKVSLGLADNALPKIYGGGQPMAKRTLRDIGALLSLFV